MKVDRLVKKSFFLGLGAASLTRKNVQKFIGSLVQDKVLNKAESSKLVKKLVAEGEMERKRIEKFMASEIRKAGPLARKIGEEAGKKAEAIAKSALKKLK